MNAYTAMPTPAGEARVREDLETILAEVREEAAGDGLLAVYLLGGYAKGEGAVVAAADGSLRGFNDYDLLLVFGEPPARRERYADLSVRLARRLDIDFVDLGLVTPRDLGQAPPTLFWYECGAAHLELWREPGANPTLPRFEPADIDREEGSRLLVNRGMALLWAALRIWTRGGPGEGPVTADPAELRFAAIAAHKAVTAAGDAALLRAGTYHPRQEERLARLRAHPELTAWSRPGFLDAYEAAAAYRRRPGPLDARQVGDLWWRARDHHEAGFAAAERDRLGREFHGWEDHRRRLEAAGRRRLIRLREAARAVKRTMRGRDWLPPEDRFLLEMPALLYLEARDARGSEAVDDASAAARMSPAEAACWRERARAAVRRWHP